MKQARDLANQALSGFSGIERYAGLRTVHPLLALIYQREGNTANAESHTQLSEQYADLAETLKR